MEGGEAFKGARKYLEKYKLDEHLNNFHLELLSAFASESECYYLDVLEALDILNKKFKLNFFSYEVRYSQNIPVHPKHEIEPFLLK